MNLVDGKKLGSGGRALALQFEAVHHCELLQELSVRVADRKIMLGYAIVDIPRERVEVENSWFRDRSNVVCTRDRIVLKARTDGCELGGKCCEISDDSLTNLGLELMPVRRERPSIEVLVCNPRKSKLGAGFAAGEDGGAEGQFDAWFINLAVGRASTHNHVPIGSWRNAMF